MYLNQKTVSKYFLENIWFVGKKVYDATVSSCLGYLNPDK